MTTRSWALSFALVIMGWLSLQILLMQFTDAAPGAVALFPGDDFVARLPADIAVVGIGSLWVSVRSDIPNLGSSLYGAGAWIVLPAGLPGCLPLARTS